MVSNFKYANLVVDKQCTNENQWKWLFASLIPFPTKVNNLQPIKQIGNKGFLSDNLFAAASKNVAGALNIEIVLSNEFHLSYQIFWLASVLAKYDNSLYTRLHEPLGLRIELFFFYFLYGQEFCDIRYLNRRDDMFLQRGLFNV